MAAERGHLDAEYKVELLILFFYVFFFFLFCLFLFCCIVEYFFVDFALISLMKRERALPIPIFTCGCDQIRVIGQDPGHYERIDKLGISKTWVLFFENIITCQ